MRDLRTYSVLLRLPLVAVVVAASSWACGSTTNPEDPNGDRPPVTVTISLQFTVASSVAAATVEVTGSGISTTITAELTVSAGVATGSVTVPTGSNRTFTIRTFDEGGVEVHRGSVTVDIVEGQNPNVSITLQALTGDVPIVAQIGTILVTVSPAEDTVTTGGMTQFTATVTDANSEVVANPSLSWSSSNPQIATVDTFGQATGMRAGVAAIVVTYNGVAAAASLTVQ